MVFLFLSLLPAKVLDARVHLSFLRLGLLEMFPLYGSRLSPGDPVGCGFGALGGNPFAGPWSKGLPFVGSFRIVKNVPGSVPLTYNLSPQVRP